MKNTREKILQTLLENPGASINDLADAVGINGISIRHHLASLETNAMVTSSEERHGVGRPRLVYSLTEKGLEHFPTSYIRLSQQIITAIKDTLAEEDIEAIFTSIGKSIAKDYKDQFEGKPIDKQVKLLTKIMSNEGHVLEWHKVKDHYQIIAYTCPYLQLGSDHPEVCIVDHTLIREVLSYPVEIETCKNKGDDFCIFEIIPQKEEQ